MYIFRYASQPTAEKSVCIALQQAPLGKGAIDFFPAEGVSKNILTKLGDCIIGRVKGGVTTVLITEYYLANHEVEPVDLRIDRIDTSAAIMRNIKPTISSPDTAALSNMTPGAAVLTLTGHIEQIGDVSVINQCLGDEAGQSRLEGFAINWANKPQGVDLAYTTTLAGAGPGQKVMTGSFTGARNKAAAIIAVGFSLTGPERADYELAGHVVFAGGDRQAIVTDQMIFGPSGSEPLVAMSLTITPRNEINALRHTSQSQREQPAITQTDSNIGQLA
ncbi:MULTISPECIES: hypothetical protein [Pseudomonas]|uniref:hypothetical protein n=1 Tax=Pseudomonas TaxID=286 RepID=UPI001BAF9217|nr:MULTISPECIES: hypothetical protein [Pseudomonas]MBS4086631.1 hypothetical protein [Pseudomonas rustica]MEB0191000.1 hypothetical protein [Pseudomonas sp. CCI1.1]WPX51477.1 hypothetical protein RHM69_03820 [Pseudomonas sp. CCI1.1]